MSGSSAALSKFTASDHKLRKKDSVTGKPLAEQSVKGFYSKYDVKEMIGRGVSCTVRRCINVKTMKQYAVKNVDMMLVASEEQGALLRKEILNEIAILHLVKDHPNIIQLHDAYDSPVFFFLVFELVAKGELFDYMTQIVTMSEKRTRLVMSQLLNAVAYIHSKKVVHRDIKPENILLDENLNIKLADFGIAALISNDEELRDLFGTPGYLAPEVIRCTMFEGAGGYGRPVDCWACGVVLYSLLCGSPPFWHRRQMIMFRAIMDGAYNFNNPEWTDVRDICKNLISRLLVVEVKERLTAVEALSHPFFHPDGIALAADSKVLFGRRRFKVAVYAVIAILRLQKLHLLPLQIELSQLLVDPYAIRFLRKTVDHGAFRIYGHWVQKGEVQNRALLFENEPKKLGLRLQDKLLSVKA